MVLLSTQSLSFFKDFDPIQINPIAQFDHSKKPNSSFARFAIVSYQSKSQLNTHKLFDGIPVRDTFAWNSLIQTHLGNGDSHLVLPVYQEMLLRGVRVDRHTLPRVLTAASRLSKVCFTFGKQVHGQALKLGFCCDGYVANSLIEMYGRLDCANSAKCVFDSYTVCSNSKYSWTLLCRLYISEGEFSLAVNLFYKLVDLGCEIDSVALVTVIGACGMLNSLLEGRKVHKIVQKCGLEFDVLVSNSLIKMYIDCGSIQEAQKVFEKMGSRDAISWTEMVAGYVQNGGFNEGLKLFKQMNLDGIKPDSFSISSVLPACGRTTAQKHGKEIHGYLLRNGICINLAIQNALMDMYVKSGFIELASRIFERMIEKDVISWTIMISGYGLHGQGKLAVSLFNDMQKTSNVRIDQMTYIAVFHACLSARLVEQGRFYFNSIMSPKPTHCASMVALLTRSKQFDEARLFIEEHKIERDVEVLRAILDGCRNNHCSKTGKRFIDQLCDLEPVNTENYILLSNWYAQNGKQDMADRLKETIRDMGLTPRKAYSWIEFRNKVHVFGTGDVNHPRSEKIYWELQSLMKKLEEQDGFRLDSDFSFHDVDEERECLPIGHSEMLAISFGLISTQQGVTIRVTKNLRVCHNCHDIAKAVSRMVNREIILKDPYCFHHFKDGVCSCGDFW